MTDVQLYIGIGLRTIAVLASLTVSLVHISAIRKEIRALRSEIKLLAGEVSQ